MIMSFILTMIQTLNIIICVSLAVILSQIARSHGGMLIVDETRALGVYGKKGEKEDYREHEE